MGGIRMTTLVVGGGSAGSALAARLTQDGDRDVLLLEAGPAAAGFAPDVRDGSSIRGALPGHPASWSFPSHLTAERDYTLVRGRMLGGSSAVNGGYFIRARARDHHGWAQAGGDRWSYASALPVWRALETDADFPDSPLHGSTGPMPIRRPDVVGLTAAFLRAARARGHQAERDKNGEERPGAGLVPSTIVDGVRVSTATAYLPEAVRAGPGLRVEGDTTVGRVLIEGGRAVGVETARGEIRADEVVLTAGAIGTARILLSSGIGPATQLETLGVRVRADLPVGTAFSDHPNVSLAWRPEDPASGSAGRHAFPAAVHFDSGGWPDADLEILLSVKPLRHLLLGGSGTTAGSDLARLDDLPLLVGLQSPSARGTLSLQAADPGAPPRIDFHYLEEADDRRRLRVGVREATALVGMMGGRVMSLPETDLDDDALDAWVAANLGTAIHMCGTAPMGAVVDGTGQVRGIAGLRVADTSIIPVAPLRGPAASAVLVGEIIARAMRDG
jgi:predicted dehydrogenase (TIGR03970 family)